jgi:hypothetical protein
MTDREYLELAKEYLTYDKTTGRFYWLKSPNRRILVGSEAGTSTNSHGYKELQLGGVLVKAHRLVWLMEIGEMPDQIDHMNGVRSDNRIANLRSVSSKENTHNQRRAHKNSKTGVLGVIAKPSRRYAAEIRVDGTKKHLGTFDTVEEAALAYKTAKLKLHKGALA